MKKHDEPSRLRVTVRELASFLGCPFEGDGNVEIRGPAGLKTAGEGDIVFLAHPKYRTLLESTKASAVILPAGEKFDRLPAIKSENPHLSFVRVVEFFVKPVRPEPGIHPTALVAPSARIGRDVSVGAFSVIGENVDIGEETVIFPLVSVYDGVKVGVKCIIHSHVSLREGVRLGNRVIIHNGAVIGADGFGYIPLPDGTYRKIPQVGTARLEDDVEVGANTTIDRAALGETVVQRGAKIDNLVMVAHNVEVGKDTILAGQTGIAGSSKIGNNVIMGGQVGVSDHVEVGDRVIAAAQTGVSKDVPAGSIIGGSPHLDIRDWKKASILMPQLYGFIKEIKRLRLKVEELETKLKTSGTRA